MAILTAVGPHISLKSNLVMEFPCSVREVQQQNLIFFHHLTSTLYHNLITSCPLRNDGFAELVYARVDALVFNTYLKARCEILN